MGAADVAVNLPVFLEFRFRLNDSHPYVTNVKGTIGSYKLWLPIIS